MICDAVVLALNVAVFETDSSCATRILERAITARVPSREQALRLQGYHQISRSTMSRGADPAEPFGSKITLPTSSFRQAPRLTSFRYDRFPLSVPRPGDLACGFNVLVKLLDRARTGMILEILVRQ